MKTSSKDLQILESQRRSHSCMFRWTSYLIGQHCRDIISSDTVDKSDDWMEKLWQCTIWLNVPKDLPISVCSVWHIICKNCRSAVTDCPLQWTNGDNALQWWRQLPTVLQPQWLTRCLVSKGSHNTWNFWRGWGSWILETSRKWLTVATS